MNKIKSIIILLTMSIGFFGLCPATVVSAAPNPVFLADFQSQAAYGANQVGGGQGNGQGKSIPDIISTIVNILSLIVGMVAVIMVIVSGLRYVTSGGDSNKVSSARSALIAALIGLVIASLAQFMIHFVIANASG